MPTKTLVIFCVLCVGLLCGCFKASSTSNHNSNNNSTSSNSRATAEKIGIAECDEFVAKYETCISDHVPDKEKRQYQENIDMWRRLWRDMAAKSDDKPGLAKVCKRKIEEAREAMQSFKCEM